MCPDGGMGGYLGTPMNRRPPRHKEPTLKSYAFIFRLTVLLSLVLTSAFMAGWKWEHIAH
jgi:hypothetical protein